MKRYTTFLWCGILCLVLGTGFVSCTDYLDKEPDSDVDLQGAFKDFMNFQGYVEELYSFIPNKVKGDYNMAWNFGDDELFNITGQNQSFLTVKMDVGDFRAWTSPGGGMGTYLYGGGRLWQRAFYSIRKANMGLDNLDKMVGTDEERDIIAGQLYFFRAWWHFELMMWLGGLAYIDETLDASVQLTRPRQSYQECADLAGADFRKAADLLPIDWDNTTTGKNTAGRNQLRINKIMALGYLGKNYLWAASPLMKNGAQLNAIATGMTYNYDEAYAQKAAQAFGELLSLVESGQTQYALVEFNYSDVYNHTKAKEATNSYSELCYTRRQNMLLPGATEAIFRGTSTDGWCAYNLTQTSGPTGPGWSNHDKIVRHPSANSVDQYGMENGLPLDDPDSGFDPNYPFKGRDPRFYHDILFDGFKYVNGTIDDERRFISTYTSSVNPEDPERGLMRTDDGGSRSGYFIQKIVPHTANFTDKDFDYMIMHTYISYMRLADIYLMYAEACAAFGGASGKASNFGKTAEGALNTVRQRVGAGNVGEKYTADRRLFIDEVRRERSVELMFEGHRFNDLQRWLLLTEKPYSQKWAQDFTRVETLQWFLDGNDPRDARIANWETGKRVILTRPLGVKHYWLPFPEDEVYLYPEFPQNPGW